MKWLDDLVAIKASYLKDEHSPGVIFFNNLTKTCHHNNFFINVFHHPTYCLCRYRFLFLGFFTTCKFLEKSTADSC